MDVGDRVCYFKRTRGSAMTRSATRVYGTITKVNKTMVTIETDDRDIVRAFKDNVQVIG